MDIAEFLAILQDPSADDDTICEAAQELLSRHSVQAIPVLWERLETREDRPWVIAELITSLGGLVMLSGGDHPAFNRFLLGLLQADDVEDGVKNASVTALGIVEASDALELVASRLDSKTIDGDDSSVFVCLLTIGRLTQGRAEYVGKLAEYLNHGDVFISRTAAEALGIVGPAARDVLPELEMMAETGEYAERKAAELAISKIKGASAQTSTPP